MTATSASHWDRTRNTDAISACLLNRKMINVAECIVLNLSTSFRLRRNGDLEALLMKAS